MIEAQAPNIALRIIDDAIQAHGGGGVTSDFGLARAYASQRALRLADGPGARQVRRPAAEDPRRARPSPWWGEGYRAAARARRSPMTCSSASAATATAWPTTRA